MSVRITEFNRDGLTFDVLDEGPEDGDPVVLLHGFPESASTWSQVAHRLHGRGLRTYAPDQRGYSPRARPRGRRAYHVDELTADVVALVERIGRPVHLVGHDWGAIVGWSVVGRHPELVRSWTAVSVAHPTAFLRSLVRSTQLLKSWYMFLFQIPLLVERVVARRPGIFLRSLAQAGMTPQEVEHCRTHFLERGCLPGGLGWYRALPLAGSSARLDAVGVPTTFVWSDDDVALGRKGAVLTREHMSGPYEFVELSGVTHWIPTQAPDALAEAILRRVGSV